MDVSFLTRHQIEKGYVNKLLHIFKDMIEKIKPIKVFFSERQISRHFCSSCSTWYIQTFRHGLRCWSTSHTQVLWNIRPGISSFFIFSQLQTPPSGRRSKVSIKTLGLSFYSKLDRCSFPCFYCLDCLQENWRFISFSKVPFFWGWS